MDIYDVMQEQRRAENEASRQRVREAFEAEKQRAQAERDAERRIERALTTTKVGYSAFPVCVVTKPVLKSDGTEDRRYKSGVLWDPVAGKAIADHQVNSYVARTSMTLARRATSDACLEPRDEIRESRKEHTFGIRCERGGEVLDVGDAGEWEAADRSKRAMRQYESRM